MLRLEVWAWAHHIHGDGPAERVAPVGAPSLPRVAAYPPQARSLLFCLFLFLPFSLFFSLSLYGFGFRVPGFGLTISTVTVPLSVSRQSGSPVVPWFAHLPVEVAAQRA